MKVPADLRDPVGDITLEMFPNDDDASLLVTLQAYLDRGYELVAERLPSASTATADAAATAWAYHVAFSAVAARLAASYANAALTGLGSLGISSAQIKYYSDRAAEALEAWTSIITTPIGVASGLPRTSSTTFNTPRWFS